jgi:hypothetical protein
VRGTPRPWQGQGRCGSGLHTASTGIAGSAESASLEAVPAAATPLTGIDVDLEACTVFLRGGTYGRGAELPRDVGAALHDLAALPRLSVADATSRRCGGHQRHHISARVQVKRPRSRCGPESTGEWNRAGTEEVPRRAA